MAVSMIVVVLEIADHHLGFEQGGPVVAEAPKSSS
jgi:hypothetical protein